MFHAAIARRRRDRDLLGWGGGFGAALVRGGLRPLGGVAATVPLGFGGFRGFGAALDCGCCRGFGAALDGGGCRGIGVALGGGLRALGGERRAAVATGGGDLGAPRGENGE